MPSAQEVDQAAQVALRRRHRWALWVALLMVFGIPAAGIYTQVESGQRQALLATDKMADALTQIASHDPDGWYYNIGRFTLLKQDLQDNEPLAAIRITGPEGKVVMESSTWQSSSLFSATRPVHDSGAVVGEVSVQYPTAGLGARLVITLAASVLVAALIYALIVHVAVGDVQRHIRQLHHLRQAAEQAGLARTAFLATMSHEIRTPMNGVLGMASMLQQTNLDATQRRYVEIIHSSGESLLRVINDILDFSRLESGSPQLDPRPFEPSAVVLSVMALLEPLAHRKGLQVVLERHGTLPAWVEADPDRLRQLLINLLGNAIKFSDHGTVQVSLESPAPGRLRLGVTDQGIGMSPDQVKSIFEPFMQADKSIARRYGGTGLGLAISRRLVQAMGGDIVVHSQPGAGSAFSFEMDAQEVTQPHRPALAADAPTHAALAELRVLVVDDDEVNCIVAQTMLRVLGIDCSTVNSGAAAVRAAGAGEFDVVLMDLELGDFDGFETTRRVRRLPGIRQPRIVAVTAHALPEMRESSDTAGMDAYLTKPLVLSELEQCLARLQRTAQAPALATT